MDTHCICLAILIAVVLLKYMDDEYRWYPLIIRSMTYVTMHGYISESFYNDYWQEVAERREQEELAFELDKVNRI